MNCNTQEMIQETLAGRTKKIPHPRPIGRSISYFVFCPERYQKIVMFHSPKVKRKLNGIPHLRGSWLHASRAHGISKSRHWELTRLLWHNRREKHHFIWKGPKKLMESFTTEKPQPRVHGRNYIVSYKKRRKVALFCMTKGQKRNSQTGKNNGTFPPTSQICHLATFHHQTMSEAAWDELVALRCPHISELFLNTIFDMKEILMRCPGPGTSERSQIAKPRRSRAKERNRPSEVKPISKRFQSTIWSHDPWINLNFPHPCRPSDSKGFTDLIRHLQKKRWKLTDAWCQKCRLLTA